MVAFDAGALLVSHLLSLSTADFPIIVSNISLLVPFLLQASALGQDGNSAPREICEAIPVLPIGACWHEDLRPTVWSLGVLALWGQDEGAGVWGFNRMGISGLREPSREPNLLT